ncbi:hypothetical protein CITRIK5_100098 [Citricoccus sp. K5]|nr:hypothetical protein CITRIK5_100032 [Citricoccus sp. K5]VXA95227.1 hypothetical protein CITRIK5_100098 [Citricoccus sp. K5]
MTTAKERLQAHAEALRASSFWPYLCAPSDCSKAPHRGPEGPNEDMGQCGQCGSPSWSMRPWGETFGYHLDDCSLPIWHESRCQPGGTGHPDAPTIRG